MQLIKYFSLIALIITLSLFTVDSRKKSKVNNKMKHKNEGTDISSNTSAEASIPVPTGDKKKNEAVNIWSQIILSRLYAYENKLYPLLMDIGIVPKTKNIDAVLNSDIMKTLQEVLNGKIDNASMKNLRNAFDKGLPKFFTEMKKIGDFQVVENTITYKLKSGAVVPDETPAVENSSEKSSKRK